MYWEKLNSTPENWVSSAALTWALQAELPCNLERGAWSLKSARRSRERLLVPAICTRAEISSIAITIEAADALAQSRESR